jgi:hypothetical protein
MTIDVAEKALVEPVVFGLSIRFWTGVRRRPFAGTNEKRILRMSLIVYASGQAISCAAVRRLDDRVDPTLQHDGELAAGRNQHRREGLHGGPSQSLTIVTWFNLTGSVP